MDAMLAEFLEPVPMRGTIGGMAGMTTIWANGMAATLQPHF